MIANQNLLTVGEVAETLGVPIYRLQYLIRTRNIKPVQRAGILRLFTSDQLELIRAEIQSTCGNVPEVDNGIAM